MVSLINNFDLMDADSRDKLILYGNEDQNQELLEVNKETTAQKGPKNQKN